MKLKLRVEEIGGEYVQWIVIDCLKWEYINDHTIKVNDATIKFDERIDYIENME